MHNSLIVRHYQLLNTWQTSEGREIGWEGTCLLTLQLHPSRGSKSQKSGGKVSCSEIRTESHQWNSWTEKGSFRKRCWIWRAEADQLTGEHCWTLLIATYPCSAACWEHRILRAPFQFPSYLRQDFPMLLHPPSQGEQPQPHLFLPCSHRGCGKHSKEL